MAYLEGKGFELRKHDLAKERPPRALLESLVDEAHLERFINTRSPAYKARGLDVKTLTKSQAIDLVLEDPNLMKRPLVMRDGRKFVFGWNAADYDEVLGK